MIVLDMDNPFGCDIALSAATELYKISTGEFLMELFLDTSSDNGLRVSLRAFHQSELERASKATVEKEKEPRPCIQCDELNLDSVQNLVNLFVPLTGLSEAIEKAESPLSCLLAAFNKERKEEKEEKEEEAKKEQAKTEQVKSLKVPATAGSAASKVAGATKK